MANLFWKANKTVSLLETPFKTEEEFERVIFGTPEILEDIFLIKRQIRGGSKQGIPDIVGIDKEGKICIIEMKNVTVDSAIIPQVLQYAIWAEQNPDSIKSLWLEADDKPDDLPLNWEDGHDVRIIVIAPTILRSTLDAVGKIAYPVDLLEVKRWLEGKNQFLLVNKLEEDKKAKPSVARGLEEYNSKFYLKNHGTDSVKHFMHYIKEVERLVKLKKWPLETKFNKEYCGFKAGFFLAFGVHWLSSKRFCFFFKLSEQEAKRAKVKYDKYDNLWKQAIVYIQPGETKIKKLLPLFEMAYGRLSGD